MLINRHYVYVHRRLSTGEIFYCGKGSERARSQRLLRERAFTVDNRSLFWRRVVHKDGGFIVEVVRAFATDKEAQDWEKDIIAFYGRRNLKKGSLVNLTDGGDGHAGLLISTTTRQRRSAAASGPRSVKWVAAIRRARANGGNGGVVKRRDKLPLLWRQHISQAKIGVKNPMFGRTGRAHPTARQLICSETGRLFDSVSAAASQLGLNMKTLYNKLTGHRPNTTSLRFL